MASTATALVEKVVNLEEKIESGDLGDSTNSSVRYAAYLARLKPIFIKSTRYLAYTSDFGEAFRPQINPRYVQAAYGVSWLYLLGDVGYEGWKTHLRRKVSPQIGGPSESTEVGLVVAKRAVFQGTASMLFPALTIHSAVKYSPPLFRNVQRPRVKAWGPTVTGLAIVPFLPFIFDEPVEHIVDAVFEKIETAMGLSPHHVENVREDIPRAKKDL